jgi:hypothetical protein
VDANKAATAVPIDTNGVNPTKNRDRIGGNHLDL